MLKCVILDMDGTIADTLPLCIKSFKIAIETLSGEEITDRQITDTFGPSEEGTISVFLPDKLEEGVNLYLDSYTRLHKTMCPKPFDGIIEIFETIKKNGIKLALVTGKGIKSLKVTLKLFGLEDIFDAVEAGKPEGADKPQAMKRVMQKLNLLPEECVYIGDTVSDIISAHSVAISIISAAWAECADTENLRKYNPDKICYKVTDLKQLLGF
jgi:phosphoglycolate phosphatase/pyrophosphatase PpaX